jgi:electron transport complex protein RnfA
MSYLGIIMTFVFIDNVFLREVLGVCASKIGARRVPGFFATGFAVVILCALSSLVVVPLDRYLLGPLGLERLRMMLFVLILFPLLKFLERLFLKSGSPLLVALAGEFRGYLSSCLVYGISLLVLRGDYGILESLLGAAAAGAGYVGAIYLLDAIREQLRLEWVPKPFQGLPITFISAGLMSLAFMAFDAAFLKNLAG